MNDLVQIMVYTALASACIPLGGLLARIERIHPNWLENEFRHFVIAFGGGVLLAAVALVLIPESIQHMNNGAMLISLCLLTGGFCFFLVEKALDGKSPKFRN